jgi:threonine/homoserine/homoserine lactone efflux protein
MDLYISDFILLYLVNFLNLLIPGTNFTITARNSIVYSRTIGIFTALGIVCGSSIHKVPTILGLGFLQAHSYWFHQILKYSGSIFLLYFGVKIILNSNPFKVKQKIIRLLEQLFLKPKTKIFKNENDNFIKISPTQQLSQKEAFAVGFFADILNPQATLCFMAIVSATVSIDTPIQIRALYSIALVITSIFWYLLLALFFSQSFIVQRSYKIQAWVERTAGVCLITFGYKLFCS